MKKGPHDEMNDDLRPEYDLSQLLSHSVQGKYAERFRAERIVMPTADQNHGKLSDKPAAGLDRDEWQRRLVKLESRYGYADGFKLLYCPWSTLFEGCEVAFLSMNPGGRTPDSADLRTVSDERGNSYRIERYTTKSPITEQYLQLCELMRVSPDRVLCGVLAPFRTKEWKASRDGQNLAIGRAFWETALRVQSSLKVLVCSGKPVKDALIDMLGGELDRSVPAEWGNILIRQYHIADPPCSLIALPQLSRFRLLSRPASRRQVASVLEEWDLAEEGHPWPDLPETSTKTDSRRMCFEQGKAFVYMPPDDDSRVITEWPNGVIEDHLLADDTITRTWPDGRVERFHADDPAAKECPYIAPPGT